MNDFWNKRFGAEEYAYGENPNNFLQAELSKVTPGSVLFPAEGEGRNAVFAARLGWKVHAFDPSREGKRKAEQLANKHNVKIDYQLKGYEEMNYLSAQFDCIVLIYAHMPSVLRKVTHKKLLEYLKPGGLLLIEGFSKNQLNYNSGGPQSLDFLYSEESLKEDFANIKSIRTWEEVIQLNEGPFHQGKASVIRTIGIK